MATSAQSTANIDRVNQGLRIVRDAMAPILMRELVAVYHQRWWDQGVLLGVSDQQRRDLPMRGKDGELITTLDVAAVLTVIDRRWAEAFNKKLTRADRNYIRLLLDVRNAVAHHGAGDMPDDRAQHSLQTMVQLLERHDAPRAAEIRKMIGEMVTATAPVAAVAPDVPKPKPVKASPGQQSLGIGIMPWRDVVQPHDDVARGRYQVAQFAADLSQVVAGRAEPEYQDAREFFARTFLTDGMSRLLTSAVERLSGKGGDPVIQLKTAFGGGKTHSMLALYHLLKSGAELEKLAAVQEIETNASITTLPQARVGVLVGTALDPARPHGDAGGNGVEVRTLWGEMAAQIGGRAAFDVIQASDAHGSPPGSSTLIELFERFAPCAILIDELVAYARAIYGTRDLPSGSFDAVLTFVQNLTEAVKAVPTALLVAAIPESDIEAGGEAGQLTLERLQKTFGRVEAVWQPVVADEGFEVVRRRLFAPVSDEAAKEAVCLAFCKLYSTCNEFPRETSEMSYLDRMRSSYPIHPELFDRLYDDWSTLETFQRTRGVLRLMAAAIHVLWMRDDHSPLIMPGDLPIDERAVRDELLNYLGAEWNGVVDNDVDGQASEPRKVDAENPLFGRVRAAQRCARTVFLGSAPQSKEHQVRGLEETRVRLGVARPNESLPVYNDALNRLTDRLTYLFSAHNRFWYDTHPNVSRKAEEIAQRLEEHEVEHELLNRLRERDRGEFTAVHYANDATGSEVGDELSVRLVVLGPEFVHTNKARESEALTAARNILEKRGNAPRIYRNTLLFVAPDKQVMESLRTETRRYLAWQRVLDQKEALNLDQAELRNAENQKSRSDSTVNLRIKEAYCWLLAPSQVNAKDWQWEATRLQSGDKSYIGRASDKAVDQGVLITSWSPILVKRELDQWLWRDGQTIGVRRLWEYFCSHGYLSRLRDAEVLKGAIAQGARSADFFGYAAGLSESGRYEGLLFDAQASPVDIHLDGLSVLVKPEAAAAQQQRDREEQARRVREVTGEPESRSEGQGLASIDASPTDSAGGLPATPAAPALSKGFHGSVILDPVRAVSAVAQVHEEIVAHLASLQGAKVRLTLEIDVSAPEGIPEGTQRIVSENSAALRLDNAEFD